MSGEQARLAGTISLQVLTRKATANERQKAEGCLALTRFRETSGQLPGTLERAVQDPPDFLITDAISRRAGGAPRHTIRRRVGTSPPKSGLISSVR